jgi:hypothetical protein
VSQDDVAAELRALREEMASLREQLARGEEESRNGSAPATAPPSYTWLSSLEPRARRRPTIPRLFVEAIFLIAVAAVAAVAELEPLEIVGVMAAAWLLVAVGEWAASRADRRHEELLYATPPAPEPVADPAWFSPPVEQTMLDDGGAADSETAVAKLPPVVESEQTEDRPAAT